jgi:AAA15 family ATPase/GTPase
MYSVILSRGALFVIVSFSVSNFRSFSAEETFSLVASNRLAGSHEEHAVPIPDSAAKVLRTAVIYGPNGAGKSNLFKALKYVKSIALDARDKNSSTGRQVFRFNGGANEPSSFDLQFVAENTLFRFAFKVNDHHITEEWLARVDGNRDHLLYERVTDEKGNVIINLDGLKKSGKKLEALATVGGPQNQSFLATVRVTLDPEDYGSELGAVLHWFKRSLLLVSPDTQYRALGNLLATNNSFKDFAGDFLRASSTGVDHLDVVKKKITEEELRTILNKEFAAKVLNDISEDGQSAGAIVHVGEGDELVVEKTGEKNIYRITIQAAHEHSPGKSIALELDEESDGTRRLLNLMPALHLLQNNNAVFFIDEIDRSLHPILVLKFMEFFLKSCTGGQRQIIVTTHESNLLKLNLLRRDEIWFAEKDQRAATRLYSLADFKVRKDLAIREHYLQGRFGAIPFLGDLDRLLAEQNKSE